MAQNKRIFYAVEYLGFAQDGSNTFTPVHGTQSCGTTTNFNLDQYFELGQLAIYENKEVLPEVSLSCQKLLDGYPLIYHLATQGAAGGTLVGRSRVKTIGGLATFDDTQDSASGTPIAEFILSGLFVNSVSYTFDVNNAFTEDVGLVGNNRLWRDTDLSDAGHVSPIMGGITFNNSDTPLSSTGSGGIQRRWHFIFDLPTSGSTLIAGGGAYVPTFDANGQVVGTKMFTCLPPDIDGISASGLNLPRNDGTLSRFAHVQNITASVNLNRQDMFELGLKGPYFKFVQFPVEVTCAITCIPTKWDSVSATAQGLLANANNLLTRSIYIYTTEGTSINLGTKNKLSSIDFNAGDTGGANGTVTYNYVTYNDFTVQHPSDPSTAFR